MSKSKLEIAKKTHKTDFGTYEDYSAKFEDTKIETPVGTYICYHDGTFSDITKSFKLMWIQAPWGMTYNGKKFKGEPINLNWHDATNLFGYDGTIPEISRLRKTDIDTHKYNEYKRGDCTVTFSGYSDWRLPTAKEILTLGFCVTKEPWQRDESKYDGYHHPSDTNSQQLREKLFPDCPHIYEAWSANDNGYDAWGSDGRSDSLGDFKKNVEKSILFVRHF